MTDLFEEDDNEVIEVTDDFDEVDVDVDVDLEMTKAQGGGLDARRRLESMLDEKKLRDELEDFSDFDGFEDY